LPHRLRADIEEFSLPVLLRYEDRNTMAFGVESRVPFLDHQFMEWIATLPSEMLLRSGWTKYIMRESLRDILPGIIYGRKSKLGFSTPESKWLCGPLKDWLIESLESPAHLPEVVQTSGVKSLLKRFQSADRSKPLLNLLFRLAIYESWMRQHAGGRVSSGNGRAGIR
jgi:asparagine synthase (glutamine-hydrolysing)